MIIDLILDRKCDEEHGGGYSPRDFYWGVTRYGSIGHDITRAMDYGTETDVRNALCDYIDENDYNPNICDYIRARKWLCAC